MIGNDIVDFQLARKRSRWRNGRFIEKVFSVEEQKLIYQSDHQFRTIWLLWSLKESAYKAHFRKYPQRFFSPCKLECQLLTDKYGLVIINKDMYHTSTIIKNEYVYTIAYSDQQSNVESKSFKIDDPAYSHQHKQCSDGIIHAFSKHNDLPNDYLSIKKDKMGIPRLYYRHKVQKTPVTITHHGNYCGYAFMK
jgi:phosphopantetheinyl transferase (holo-ACP synthase)